MIRNIILLLEILTFLYGFAAIYGKKMKYEIYDVVFIISDLMLLIGINEKSIPVSLVTLTYVLMGIYCMIKYKASLKRAVVNLVLVLMLVTAVQALFFMPAWFFSRKIADNSGVRELIASVVLLLILCIFPSSIRLKDLSDFIMRKRWLLVTIGIFILVVLGGKLWKIKIRGILDASDYVPIIYFVILIFIMVYEWQKTKTEADLEKAQLQMNMLYYDAYEGLIQSVREKQHDFKNHINAISGMLYADVDCAEIIAMQKEYFEDILHDLEDTSPLTMIENPSLSGFIIHKVREAGKQGITVEQQCSFTSQKLKIPEYKLVEMLGILLDNAIEATPIKQKDKKIWIRMWKENDLFWFSVENYYEGELVRDQLFNQGYTSKGKGRGLGLTKLQRMLKENGGDVYLQYGEKEHNKTVRFVIYIPI